MANTSGLCAYFQPSESFHISYFYYIGLQDTKAPIILYRRPLGQNLLHFGFQAHLYKPLSFLCFRMRCLNKISYFQLNNFETLISALKLMLVEEYCRRLHAATPIFQQHNYQYLLNLISNSPIFQDKTGQHKIGNDRKRHKTTGQVRIEKDRLEQD